jgi:hypothetical protein
MGIYLSLGVAISKEYCLARGFREGDFAEAKKDGS